MNQFCDFGPLTFFQGVNVRGLVRGWPQSSGASRLGWDLGGGPFTRSPAPEGGLLVRGGQEHTSGDSLLQRGVGGPRGWGGRGTGGKIPRIDEQQDHLSAVALTCEHCQLAQLPTTAPPSE